MKKLSLSIYALAIIALVACGKKADNANTANNNKDPKKENVDHKKQIDAVKNEGQDDPIKNIKAMYADTEGNVKSYKEDKFVFEDDMPFYSVYFYSQDDVLKKVTYMAGGDHSGITENYYFDKDGKFYFAFIDEGGWQFSGEGESQTVDMTTQHRFYYNEGNCIKALKKEAEGSSDNFKDIVAKAPNKDVDKQLGAPLVNRAETFYNLFKDKGVDDKWKGLDYLEIK